MRKMSRKCTENIMTYSMVPVLSICFRKSMASKTRQTNCLHHWPAIEKGGGVKNAPSRQRSWKKNWQSAASPFFANFLAHQFDTCENLKVIGKKILELCQLLMREYTPILIKRCWMFGNMLKIEYYNKFQTKKNGKNVSYRVLQNYCLKFSMLWIFDIKNNGY